MNTKYSSGFLKIKKILKSHCCFSIVLIWMPFLEDGNIDKRAGTQQHGGWDGRSYERYYIMTPTFLLHGTGILLAGFNEGKYCGTASNDGCQSQVYVYKNNIDLYQSNCSEWKTSNRCLVNYIILYFVRAVLLIRAFIKQHGNGTSTNGPYKWFDNIVVSKMYNVQCCMLDLKKHHVHFWLGPKTYSC